MGAGSRGLMKSLISEVQDASMLEDIGRASVQIVHDLKNQLNGLKLYATFLRKRMEKSERPADEQETIAKLIAGLERAASDMTVLVHYSRPVELRLQPGVVLGKLLASVAGDKDLGGTVTLDLEHDSLTGEFDVAATTEALKAITAGALGMRRAVDNSGALLVRLRRDETGPAPAAVIEWHGVPLSSGSDPFRSFAGSDALRMSVAAKIIEAHGGEAAHEAEMLRVRLPLGQ